MHKTFKEALEAGYLEPATWNDGTPFEHEGRTFYGPTQSGANLSIKRWHTLGDIMARHDKLKLTDDVLHTAFALIKDMAGQGMRQMLRGDGEQPDTTPLEEIRATITRLEQRMALGMDVAMVAEMASVWFLTEDDCFYEYDSSRARTYIESWSRDPELFPKFFSLPLGRLVPLQGLLSGDTLRHLKALTEIEIFQLLRLALNSTSLGLTNDTMTTIESRKETLLGLHGWTDGLLNSTTNSSPASSESNGKREPSD